MRKSIALESTLGSFLIYIKVLVSAVLVVFSLWWFYKLCDEDVSYWAKVFSILGSCILFGVYTLSIKIDGKRYSIPSFYMVFTIILSNIFEVKVNKSKNKAKKSVLLFIAQIIWVLAIVFTILPVSFPITLTTIFIFHMLICLVNLIRVFKTFGSNK